MIVLTKKQIAKHEGFASDGLREQILSELHNDEERTYHCAYTDYGGNFLDKVFIAYFKEKYPNNIVSETTCWNGENAFIFGQFNKEYGIDKFIEETENYLLGFESIEDSYSEMEMEVFNNFVEEVCEMLETSFTFKKEGLNRWLYENKYGYYSILTTGVDYCESDLVQELVNKNIITKKVSNEKEKV